MPRGMEVGAWWGRPAQDRQGLTACSETRKGPFSASPVWTSSGPGMRAGRRHDGAGQAGGAWRGRPRARGQLPFPLPSLPWVGLGHNWPPILTLCPPAPAPSTCSTSCPARAEPPPPSPAPHGPRDTSAPRQIQAGVASAARRLELPQLGPSLATAAAPPVTRRDAGAEALRGAEVPDFPPAARGARRDL